MRWLYISDVVESEKYPFSEQYMRRLLHYRKDNGLHAAVKKVGKRLLIREDLLDQWIENEGSIDG